jgi:hypothetical protein
MSNGEQDGNWELLAADSAGQSFAFSGHSTKRRAQASAGPPDWSNEIRHLVPRRFIQRSWPNRRRKHDPEIGAA